jgi:hypothetical protein
MKAPFGGIKPPLATSPLTNVLTDLTKAKSALEVAKKIEIKITKTPIENFGQLLRANTLPMPQRKTLRRSQPANVAFLTRRATIIPRGAARSGFSGPTAADLYVAEPYGLHNDYLHSAAREQTIDLCQSVSNQTRQELLIKLDNINPNLAILLRGAWFNLGADGPAGAWSAAHCLVEVVDQTLQMLSDESMLANWLMQHDRVGGEYIDPRSGRPTRRGRLAFAMQKRSKSDNKVVDRLASLLSPLHDELEHAKHARADIGVEVVRCQLITTEAFLVNLLRSDV